MIGLVVATVALAVPLYVALRRIRPVGAVLNPWPYILRTDWRRRFEMGLPENPDEPICGAHPSRDTLLQLGEQRQSVTACYLPPHPVPPGFTRAHVGLLVGVTADDRFTWAHTWLEQGRATPQRTYRVAWWRRALIRLASA